MTKLQKDHLTILLESMDSKLQITLEAFGTLNDKIDGVEDRLKADISRLDFKIDTLAKRVNEVDTKVDAVHAELTAHRNDTESHRHQPKRTLKRIV